MPVKFFMSTATVPVKFFMSTATVPVKNFTGTVRPMPPACRATDEAFRLDDVTDSDYDSSAWRLPECFKKVFVFFT